MSDIKDLMKHEAYPYAFDASVCNTCEGNCCIGESGYIWISKEERENLAIHLNININDLMNSYVKKVGYKYTIIEKKLSDENYACIFFDLEKKQCSVYDARPNQCRTFPFWDYFKTRVNEVKQECPAIKEL